MPPRQPCERRFVAQPLEAVVPHAALVGADLALANAGYTGCEFVELCDKSEIERDLIRGTSLIHKALATAETTQ